ncbi:C2 calcium-dependent domain-containing protein 4C-like [Bombina bombina]|uniref:C2 calcium-dependent domain-containing protein 4C-like n=1 Tax=Bombina bombina TaxID=8345 RepID=UPI00235AC4C9|nr:C2 calcium-dependent domain-containing protein 4C-like [Bombina bombina]
MVMFFSKKKLLPSCPNILTPDQIPKFFIPPKLSPMSRRGGHCGSPLQKRDGATKSIPRELLKSANRHFIQVEDMEQEMEVPDQAIYPPIPDPIIGSLYLVESPHTRRRESLFHEMCNSQGNCEMTTVSPLDPEYTLSWRTSPLGTGTQQVPLGCNMDSETTSSAESSPFSSPLLPRSLAGSLVGHVYDNQHNFSRTLSTKYLTRENSLSTETSSTDTSPSVPQRQKHYVMSTSMIHLVPPPVYQLDFICCQERLTKETEVMLGNGGTLRLSAEYMKEVGRLRVKLVSAENLYPAHQDPKSISCCVVMYLQPGKLQKQRSTIIRKSRNPIFNEDFYFEGVDKEELDSRSLKLKVMNRGSNIHRDSLLGYSELTLCSILPS